MHYLGTLVRCKFLPFFRCIVSYAQSTNSEVMTMTMLVLASSMAPPTSMISVATSIPGISSGALRD
jgi:hypothetical protein